MNSTPVSMGASRALDAIRQRRVPSLPLVPLWSGLKHVRARMPQPSFLGMWQQCIAHVLHGCTNEERAGNDDLCDETLSWVL
jgi:hypothetical protein